MLPGRNFQGRHGPNALKSHRLAGFRVVQKHACPAVLLLKEQAMVRVGDKVLGATLYMMGPQGPKTVSTREIFAPGRKVVAFALPGALTPT